MLIHVCLARSTRIVWKDPFLIPQGTIAEHANPRPTAEEEILWRQWKDTGVFNPCIGMKRLNIYQGLIASKKMKHASFLTRKGVGPFFLPGRSLP